MFRCQLLLVFVVFCLISSCKRDETRDKIEKVIDSQIYFGSLKECVTQNDQLVDLSGFLKKYSYIYVVYLQDNCNSCYKTFIDWYKRLDAISVPVNFNVLFVIQGYSNESFMQKVKMIEDIDNEYCVIMDPNNDFINANSEIPHWIINASVLIDSDNKIKIVGAPWLNKDMEELFLKTINNGT